MLINPRQIFLGILMLLIVFYTPLFALTIKLQNGSYLQGEIISSDETGLEFKRWDTGGVITFKWEQLPPEEVQRIHNLLHIKVLGNKISALIIYLNDGKIITGVVLEETDRNINLKTLHEVKQILKEHIETSEPIQVDILEVYTPEEAYEIEAKKYDLNQAENNYKLAEYCLKSLGLLDKARELFTSAANLDKTYRAKSLQRIKELNKEYLSNEITKINDMLNRGKPKNARTILAKLKEQTVLQNDSSAQKIIQQAEQRIIEAEERAGKEASKGSIKKVINDWHKVLNLSLSKIAANDKLTYANVTEYLNRFLIKEITTKVAERLKIEDAEVQKIWQSRTLDVSDKKTAAYGNGSFIVAGSLTAPSPENIEEYAKHKEKMRLIQQAKNAASKKKKLLNVNTWWKNASITTKRNWLMAYFANRQMKVIEKKTDPCLRCRGKGVIRKSHKVFELCPRCQGTTLDISIIYY